MSILPALGAALLVALPLTASAQNERDVRRCIFTSDAVREVTGVYSSATGETHVVQNGRRVRFETAYPEGPQHAAGASWYINNEPIEVNGARYVKFGLPRILGVNEVTRIAHHRQALVFAEAGLPGATPDIVYVAVRQGCEFQPYQREIDASNLRDDAPEPDAPRAEPLAIGQTHRGTLSTTDARAADDSHYDLYTFTATAGQQVVITLASEDFDTYLSVGTMSDDAFVSIDSNDDGPDMGTDSQITFTAPRSGTFVVRANSLSGGETGRYTLSLGGAQTRPATVTPVRVGATTSGRLSSDDAALADGSHYDVYSFLATAGQRYVVTLASEDFDTYLAVGTLDGEEFVSIDSNDDGPDMGTNSQVTFTAPRSGTLVVRANSLSGGRTGRYTLRIERR